MFSQTTDCGLGYRQPDLFRTRADMGRGEHVWMVDERIIFCGFNSENIEGSGHQVPGLQSRKDSRLIHNSSSACIDQHTTGLQFTNELFIV